MKKILILIAVFGFSLLFTTQTFALVSPPREQLVFNPVTKTFSGIFTNSNESSSIQVLLKGYGYNAQTGQPENTEYISLGNIPITGGAFTLPLQNNVAFQQLTPSTSSNSFLNTTSGKQFDFVVFRIPDPANTLNSNTGFAEFNDFFTISNSSTTTSNTNSSGSNTSGSSSSSTTTVIPDVVKLNINHSARKLTGTKNNPVPNATLDFELYSHQHPTAAVSLGSTPGASGNFSIDIPAGKFNTLTVEDGYFIGAFPELPGVGEAVLDKIRVKISGATAKDNLGFTVTNVVNSNTNGSNSSGSGPGGAGNTPNNTTNPGSGPGGAGNTPFPNNSNSEDIEKLEDPLGEGTTLEGLILKIFEIIMYVGVPLVAFFLIYSGFMFVAAQGNEEKLQTAKNRLLYTIIGAIILLGAWTISQAIKGTVEDIKSGGQARIEMPHFG